MIGRKLSHFRVLDRIGEGGMGVVYRAEDDRLRRVVALKVLPPDCLADAQRRARFLREARAAASISHPNVAVVHEIDEADGVVFIAMEMIEGKTLREIIAGRPLPIGEVLRVGLEIAEGMAAAHQARVIHRDLKPDNVIITSDGRVKILDFGLAKLLEDRPLADADGASEMTTVAEDTTLAGRVLGTAAYMSPEQARGGPVDARSDQFSFGIVLYEMATGRAPFRGSTFLDTLTAILREEPVPAARLNPEVPAELERIIGTCLRKDRGERYEETRDLVIELRRLEGGGTRRRKKSLGGWAGVLGAVGIGLAVVTAGVVGLLRHGGRGDNSESLFQSMRVVRLASIRNLTGATLSPDGRFLGYVVREGGKHILSVRQVSTGSDIRILSPQTTPISGLVFSRDGDHLYYLAQDADNPILTALYEVASLGGTPRKVLSDIDSPAAFSSDGRTFAFLRADATLREIALLVARSDGTAERKLAVRKFPNTFTTGMGFSPDGRRVAVGLSGAAGATPFEIAEIDVEDGTVSRLGSTRWSAIGTLAWLPQGSGLALTGARVGDPVSQVWFVSHPDGKAWRITNDLNSYSDLSVSSDSATLAAVQAYVSAPNLWVAPAEDPTSAKQVTAVGAGSDLAPVAIASTPSGSLVVETPFGGSSQIWGMEADGGGRRRLSPEGLESFAPLVARRAGTIVFTVRGVDGIHHTWKMAPDGRAPTQLTRGGGESAQAISPDGRWLVFRRVEGDELWRMRLDDTSQEKIDVSRTGSRPPLYSLDGKSLWVVTFRGEGAQLRMGFELFPPDEGQAVRWFEWPRNCDLAIMRYRWTPNGAALACLGMGDGAYNIWVQPLDGGEAQPLTGFKSGDVLDFDWSPDGKRLFMLRGERTSDVVRITEVRPARRGTVR